MRLIPLILTIMIFPNLKAQDVFKVGSVLPEFTLKDQNNKPVSPSDWLGEKYIIVYFYPKDDTPGCTKEACSFRDNSKQIEEVEAIVFGVSSDNVKDHKAFAEKYNLNFSLLSDEDGKVRKQFNVPTNLLGLIPGRVTYVFDKSGVCIHVFDSQTNPNKHVQESLEVIKTHRSE